MPTVVKRVVAKFAVGQVRATPQIVAVVDEEDLFDSFVRHLAGDWGDVDEFDWRQNDEAIFEGGRILSSYSDRHGNRFWIITEADRSSTTILFPEEY